MKRIALFVNTILVILALTLTVSAQEPYKNYTYSRQEVSNAEPQAYLPDKVITGSSIGIADFSAPKDIFVTKNNQIYISDTGNNRIIVMSEDYKLIKIIDKFINKGIEDKFNNPQGIFVADNNVLYVADTMNKRVVVLDSNQNLVKVYTKPNSVYFENNLDFVPLKIAVDMYSRMYVVCNGCNSGLVQLDKEGIFLGFYGAITVTPSASELFWRMFYTNAQKENSAQLLPTVYSNVQVDSDNFIYTTVSSYGNNFDPKNLIRKLNPSGNDILRRLGSTLPIGDQYSINSDSNAPSYSKFQDVCINKSGIYSVLDVNMNRVFTYDSDGNLMYVFGGKGYQIGDFIQPEAIDVINDNTFLIIDSRNNNIIIFKPTNYGKLIYDAVNYESSRDYNNARLKWEEVVKYSSKSELAYQGIGKAYLRASNYESATKFFFLADSVGYYSVAFKYYRQLFMQSNFPIIVISLLAILVLVIIISLIKKFVIVKNKYFGQYRSWR
jgi:hypothetical protein